MITIKVIAGIGGATKEVASFATSEYHTWSELMEVLDSVSVEGLDGPLNIHSFEVDGVTVLANRTVS